MIIKNGKTISSIYKGSQVIDKIMKGTLVVYESFVFDPPSIEMTITGYTYNTKDIYTTLMNNDIDVTKYKYIIINGYFPNTNKILIYLFNDTFTFLNVDARTGGVSKTIRSAPKGINYTVVYYQSDNTIIKHGNYVSNGVNSSGSVNWEATEGFFRLASAYPIYSNYDTGITGVSGKIYNTLSLK